jgi:AraC-like DNA-binding protein
MKAIVEVKPGDSFEHWHHVTCRQFSLTDCSHTADHDFQASVKIRRFGDLALSSIWSATQHDEAIRVTRRPADIRKDQRDCFMLWLMLAGTAGLYQDGRYATLSSGDLVLQDQSRPFDLEFGQLSHAAMVMIPRPLLASRLPTVGSLAARRVPATSRIGPIVGSVVQQLFIMDDGAEDAIDRRLRASTLDIIATMLEAEVGQANAAPRLARRLDEVKAFMLTRMHDCELDAEMIAQGMCMAPRTLYRLFAQEATTPIQWLWEQRLTASYRLLSESGARVTEVALSYGFKDLSHFSRAFRGKFGVAPSAVGRGAG